MLTKSKNNLLINLFILILFVLFVALIVTCVPFGMQSIAQADSSNYQIILPAKNYMQFSNPSAYFYSNGTHYVKDEERIIILDTEATFINADFNVKSMVTFNGFLIINTGENFTKINLADKTISNLTLASITTDYELSTCGGNLFAINRNNGNTVVFDSSFSKINEQTVEAFTQCRTYATSNYIYSVWFKFDINTGAHFNVSRTVPDLTTSEKLFEISFLNKIYVGNYIYICSDSDLTAYDNDGNVIFTEDLQTSNLELYAESNNLFALNKTAKSIDCYSADENGLTHTYSIQKSGVGTHFNGIENAVKSGANVAVADSNGIYFNDKFIEIQNPVSVCTFNGKLCYSKDDNLYVYDGYATTSLNVSEPIVDLAACDKYLFALTANSVYAFDGQSVKLLKNAGGKKIATTKSGNLIYVLSSTFKAYTLDGEEATFPFNEPTENIVDFDIDFIGNLITATQNSLIKYTRSLLQFEKTSEVPLAKENYSLGEIKSVSISGENECIFSTTMDFLGITNVFNFVTENNYTPTIPPETNSVCNSKTNKNTFFYKDYKNFESVEEIAENSKLISLEKADENFTYVLWGNKLGYVKTDDVTDVEDTWSGANVLKVMLQKTRLYVFPSQEYSEYITVENGTKLTVIGEGYQNDQNWYKVSFNDKKYYVVVAGLAFDSEQVLTKEKAVYGRAKSSKVGTKVSLYSLPDEKSTITDNIIDGKELTIIGEEINGFYKVKIGTQNGYIKTENLKFGGLTNVQIISITCASVAIVTGIVILVITTKLKKKKDADLKDNVERPKNTRKM